MSDIDIRYVKWLEEKVTAQSGSPHTAARAENNHIPTPSPAVTPTRSAGPSHPAETGTRFAASDEVAGINRHTNDQEFYGSSSSVALLARVGRSPSEPGDGGTSSGHNEPDALLTSLHNPVFSRGRDGEVASARGATPRAPVSFFPQCRVFIDGFFSTLHYIFPILDRTLFMRRCESLWIPERPAEKTSFVALYFSVLSLGALVGPRIDEPIDGSDNLTWARKFREESVSLCSSMGMVTDLEMVQCYFFRVRLRIPVTSLPPGLTSRSPKSVKMSSTRTVGFLYDLEWHLFANGIDSNIYVCRPCSENGSGHRHQPQAASNV
jgi:hypothetical protein